MLGENAFHSFVCEREVDSLSIWQVCVHRNGIERNETKQNKKEEKTKTKNRETKDYNYHIDERVASEWVSVNNSRETRSLIKSTHLLLRLSVKHNFVDQVESPFATFVCKHNIVDQVTFCYLKHKRLLNLISFCWEILWIIDRNEKNLQI